MKMVGVLKTISAGVPLQVAAVRTCVPLHHASLTQPVLGRVAVRTRGCVVGRASVVETICHHVTYRIISLLGWRPWLPC